MKYIVVLGDGMADRPIKELGGRTPLEAARKPGMDFIAREGRCGMLQTLKKDMPLGSDIANLSIFGYDPAKYYPGGRGPLEAASLGIKLGRNDIAFRCNLINQKDGRIIDYSGGHISTSEAKKLIEKINKKFKSKDVEFYSGTGYRHIMVLRNARIDYKDLDAIPPHDITGEKIDDNLIKPLSKKAEETVDKLNNIMSESMAFLESDLVNLKRKKEKKLSANMLWFWGAGKKIEIPSFKRRYGVDGSIISAVDLLKGIGSFIGLEVINVPGINGYLDTNYSAKAKYALKALKEKDFVYIHVEAPDEMGHEGKVKEKIKAIEEIDKKIVSKILEELKGTDFTLAVLPDHATPIEVRTHTSEAVPYAIYSTKSKGDSVKAYSEKECSKGSLGLKDGIEFMDLLFGKKRD
jgi:2,3-bisphosphoglycerate-independent phosphoglycerate mutase